MTAGTTIRSRSAGAGPTRPRASTRAASRSPTAGPTARARAPPAGCSDRAGNNASPPPLAFRYDATAPVTAAAPARAPDANGWYNHPLRIAWLGTDPVSGIASCTSLAYGGPDSGSVGRSGSCTDRAGNTSAASAFRFRYDATAPGALAVSPARPPDHDGWYNHPVGIRWSASDALAGVASCTSITYGDPDEGGGRLVGGCSDRAGNRTAPLGFALRYDQTPPSLAPLALKGLDRLVTLRWRVSGAESVRISRSPGTSASAPSDVYTGVGSAFADRRVENYIRYRYTLTASDAAGNIAHAHRLRDPAAGALRPAPGSAPRHPRLASAGLAPGEEGPLLQRPALAEGAGGRKLVAGLRSAPAAVALELRGSAAAPRARRLHVVRLARQGTAQACPLRPAARQERVRRRLAAGSLDRYLRVSRRTTSVGGGARPRPRAPRTPALRRRPSRGAAASRPCTRPRGCHARARTRPPSRFPRPAP